MDSDEMFNWSNADVILRATHGTDSRDFRVHKLFLSFASPVFNDMFKLPQPSSETSTVDVIDVADPPRVLELVLQFIYPSTDPPAINDLTLLSEVLVLVNKYDIKVARSRLQSPLMEFAKTEPLRVYAIACRLGFEDEMKIASSHTTPIDLPGLTELPEEFKFVPATEYHRLVHLHRKYREEVVSIVTRSTPDIFSVFRAVFSDPQGRGAAVPLTVYKPIVDCVMKGTPLDYESFTLALQRDYHVDVGVGGVGHFIRSILDQANALNMTV
jgi:hypothetical protein